MSTSSCITLLAISDGNQVKYAAYSSPDLVLLTLMKYDITSLDDITGSFHNLSNGLSVMATTAEWEPQSLEYVMNPGSKYVSKLPAESEYQAQESHLQLQEPQYSGSSQPQYSVPSQSQYSGSS